MTEPLNERYVRSRGFAVEQSRELGGGVSNTVLWVRTPTGELVFKQPLAKLRVAEEWLLDQRRVWNERRCMEWLGAAMPGAAPEVRFADDENFIFGMTCVPEGGRVWKEALLAGDMDRGTARQAGAMLAEFHCRARGDVRARETFLP